MFRVEVARQRAIRELPERCEREESTLLVRIMCDLVLPVDAGELGLEELPLWPEPLKIGTCPLAEKYFLEVAERFVRRRGRLNIIRGARGTPLMIEKLNLGDDLLPPHGPTEHLRSRPLRGIRSQQTRQTPERQVRMQTSAPVPSR